MRLGDAPVGTTLVRSRSFGERVSERLVAAHVAAFVTTKGWGEGPHHAGWEGVALDVATARTPDVIRAALLCLGRCYRARDARGRPIGYRKAGVVLSEIRPAGTEQAALFSAERSAEWTAAQARLMATVDAANRRFGRRAVGFALMGLERPRSAPSGSLDGRGGASGAPGARPWEMRQDRVSPCYTTRWSDLALAWAR